MHLLKNSVAARQKLNFWPLFARNQSRLLQTGNKKCQPGVVIAPSNFSLWSRQHSPRRRYTRYCSPCFSRLVKTLRPRNERSFAGTYMLSTVPRTRPIRGRPQGTESLSLSSKLTMALTDWSFLPEERPRHESFTNGCAIDDLRWQPASDSTLWTPDSAGVKTKSKHNHACRYE